MDQESLFHDDIYDAIGSLVIALGGYKRVAGRLWPSKKLDTAYAHLKNCLRDDKPEKLDPEELMRLLAWGHAEGSHVVMHYLCDECGYERPRTKPPEQRRAELERQFVDAVERLDRIRGDLSRLDQR